MLQYATRFAEGPFWSWLLGFVLVVYLGLKGGGYDPLVHGQVGIVVWWVLLLTVAIGALPRRQLGRLVWCAVGLLAAFTAWTAISLLWTESSENTLAEVARTLTYLGIFILALFSRGHKSARYMVAAVGSAIAVVALVALASRLHPAWFPHVEPVKSAIPGTVGRLSYPLNYWNGLAALIALSFPLLLQVTASAASFIARFLAMAALPAMALTLFYTLSRGGIVAAIMAIAVYFALSPDRLPKVAAALIAATASSILIVAAAQRDALQEGLLTPLADSQRTEMIVLTLIVCALAGAAQSGAWIALRRISFPRRRVPMPRRRAAVYASVGLLAVLAVAVAADAPGHASRAWTDFKQGSTSGPGAARLGSTAGQGRYQFWSAALDEGESKPLTGTGSGTFEYWWARNGSIPGFVRDAHSLYLQSFGELGLLGLALIVAVLATIVRGGALAVVRSGRRGRPQLAAALAACAAFCVSASFDWVWQIAVMPTVVLLLAAVLLTSEARPAQGAVASPARRLAFALVSVVALVAIAIPFSLETLVRESQADARAGQLVAALGVAREAAAVEPDAATPRLQQALLLEQAGETAGAAAAARAASQREATNWRTWLVLSRLDAKLGRVGAAVRDYRRARSLNPRSPIFSAPPRPTGQN